MTEASLTAWNWKPTDEEGRPRPQGGHGPRPDRSKRRSIDEITATYPQLRPWLEKYGYSQTLGGTQLHDSKAVRAKVAEGVSVGQALRRRYWSASAVVDGDMAERIAEKLVTDGLADDVYKHLAAARARHLRSTRKASK